jgi:hypothetical protein
MAPATGAACRPPRRPVHRSSGCKPLLAERFADFTAEPSGELMAFLSYYAQMF